MRKIKHILSFVLLITTAIVFGQNSSAYKNNFKISILSFVDNAKIQYERDINKSYTFDLTASFYYINPFKGIKIEPSFRYYFKHHAPIGWYLQPKVSIGYFFARENYSRNLFTYNSSDSLISQKTIDESFKKDLRFFPIGASLKSGIQKYFGKDKRFFFDYNLGIQCCPLYYNKKEEQSEYFDTNGNKNIIVTAPSLIKTGLWGQAIYWYVFGPGSFFDTNISIGYNF